MVRGIPLAARASRQPEIASRMFSRASVSVLPCDTQPGIAGHSATIMPVSSGSNVTRSSILRSYPDSDDARNCPGVCGEEDYGGGLHQGNKSHGSLRIARAD